MSGVEVIGLISSIVAILEASSNVYQAATDISSFPQAFLAIEKRLPLVKETLGIISDYLRNSNLDENAYHAAKDVVTGCHDKAERLERILSQTIPGEGAQMGERYLRAIKARGKKDKVESLMKGILEDVQLLTGSQTLGLVAKGAIEKGRVIELTQATDEISALPPSLSDEEWQTGSTFNYNFGTGKINNSSSYITGVKNAHTGSGNIYEGKMDGDHTFNF